MAPEFTVPLCRGHHREVHRSSDETTWWENAGIDPTVAARALRLQAHPLLPTNPTSIVKNSDPRNVRDGQPPRRIGSNDETNSIEAGP
jgi:hypothetical protein